MKKLILLILIMLMSSLAFCGRAHDSAEKANRECPSFSERRSGSNGNGRAHNSAVEVFKKRG